MLHPKVTSVDIPPASNVISVEHPEVGTVYPASRVNRTRATRDEMEERAKFFIGYAEKHAPVTVRGLYYQAEVARLPGIGKDDSGYDKVQRQVLLLRRAGRLDYDWIADATRWMRKPTTFKSVAVALVETARLYRKSLWHDAQSYVEIWCEKDAIAGVLTPITYKYDVPLMVTRGFSSETFCFEAIDSHEGDDRPYYVYYLGDFDRAGRDAAASLQEKLDRFAREAGVEVIFETIGVTLDQIQRWQLPTRPPKRSSAADKKWEFDFCCEVDAIPPDKLRSLVEICINEHLDQEQLAVLKVAEDSERHFFLDSLKDLIAESRNEE